MWETQVQSLCWEDPLEKHLPIQVFLPGKSPWTEEPGRLQSMGLQRIRHDWATKHSPAPISVFLPRKFHKQRSLAGYSPWGHKKSDRTEWLSAYTHTHTHVCVCNSIFNFLRNYHIVFLYNWHITLYCFKYITWISQYTHCKIIIIISLANFCHHT